MTLSIMARCPETGDLGACVTTVNMAVGSRVPHVQSDVGVICTQAYTNVSYGIKGLNLLKLGFSPQTIINALLSDDADRESRQVAIIDGHNRIAAFTGKECPEPRGHLVGSYSVVLGNKLNTADVLDQVDKKFRSCNGSLAHKLLSAIEAGLIAGGDEKEKTSSALLVAKSNQPEKPLYVNLRVDYHENPIKELRWIFEKYRRIYHSPLDKK